MARDVDDELQFHLDMRVRKLVAQRMDPEEAKRRAVRRFGDVTAVREECMEVDLRTERVMRRRDRLGEVFGDVRYAVRALRRQPVFTVVALLLLGFGIGANTAIFALVDAVLLRSIPVPHAERLVAVGNTARVSSLSTGSPRADLYSVPLYVDIRNANRVFTGVLASGRTGPLDVVIETPGEVAPAAERTSSPTNGAEHPRARFVSGNYFAVLEVPAMLGRTFTGEGGDVAGAEPAVVISHGYWQRRFEGDRGVIGRTVTLNGAVATIVGVTPPGFDGEIVGQRTEMWIPLMMQPLVMAHQPWLEDRSNSFLLLLGRLKPGLSIDAVSSDMTAIVRRAFAEHATDGTDAADAEHVDVPVASGARGFSNVRAQSGEMMLIMMAALALVLLIVCANIANLLLARTAGRQRELTVRMALGAGRGRVLRQLFTESLVLSVAAAVLALIVTLGVRAILMRSAASGIPIDLRLDWRALSYIGGLALLTAALFGTAPALRARRLDLAGTLRSSARGLTAGIWGSAGKKLGLGKVLVAVQIALSLALLVGTAMLARSVSNLRSVDAGIASDEVVMADISPEAAGYEGDAFAAIGIALAERVASIPGVHAVSFSENGVFSGTESGTSLTVPGFVARTAQDTVTNYDNVGPNYFEAIGARFIAGRGIEARDGPSAQPVAVVNETMARFYFDGNAIGREIIVSDRSYEIVGIIADVRNQALRDEGIRRFYLAWLQTTSAPSSMSLEIRAPGAQGSLIAEVRDRITQVDATIPIRRVSPLTERMERSIQQEKLLSRVIGFAGGLALLLAAIGLYGVMAYTTMQRTGEFGLRLALGARPGELAGMVLRETIIVVAAGVLIGVPTAFAAMRLVRNQLFGIGTIDLPSLALALLVLGVSALAAACVPASRASRVGPMIALREE